ncbi:MAG: hypothetical protein AAF203_05900 [Pseudomonadota bacterium]
MRKVLIGVCLLFLAACESHHPEIYVYNDEVYTSNEVSDFEVEHYIAFGNTNFLVLNDEESLKDKERQKEIDALCLKYRVTCQKVDMSGKLLDKSQEILKSYQAFGGQKYFLFSPSTEARTRYVGVVNIMAHSGSATTIDTILKRNGLDDNTELRKELLTVKR